MINWQFTARMMATALVAFTLFRLLLLLLHSDLVTASAIPEVLRALLMGLRFDLVICCYYLVLPFAILSFQILLKKQFRKLNTALLVIGQALFIQAFLVCAADLPWFNHFFSRLNVTAFQWMDHPGFVLGMIFGEPGYYLFLIPFILASVLFIFITKRWIKPLFQATPNYRTRAQTIGLFALGGLLLFAGMRGRIEPKSPIRTGTAYFSDNAFLNQLGLNPNYTLVRTYLDSRDPRNKKVHFIDEEDIFPEVADGLGIQTPDPTYPVMHRVDIEPDTAKPNVILVLMESMNAGKLAHFGNRDSLTPFLDSLLDQGLSFTNVYTAGTHTYHGIFSTLFAYPALFTQHPMKTGTDLKYNGLPSSLKKHGYRTIYFTTHDGQFDNAEGFLLSNGIDRVVSKDNYPLEYDMSALGVPDDYMFEYGIPILNELAAQEQPFLSVFLTASDHGPYVIPPYFKPRSGDIKKQIVAYADWSLRKLVEMAGKQSWFRNTIFVFIADHGSWYGSMYEMPLSYHHSPLLYYQPALIAPQVHEGLGGQIDVFPTLMGLLKLPYVNNSFGMDLLKQQRPYIYFSSDFQYGVLSDSLYLILDREGRMQMHRYRLQQTDDVVKIYPTEAARMKRYAQIHMQASQTVKDRGLTFYVVDN